MVFGLRDPNDVFEDQSRIGQERTSCFGDHLDVGEHVGGGEPAQPPGKVEGFRCRNGVAMHDPDRIAALDDVDARQRAPGAADGVEISAAARLQQTNIRKLILDDALRPLQRLLREILQGQCSERQGHALAHPAAAHVDQFERSAAEIADDAVRPVDAGHDAERRELRLARAGEDFDWYAADPFGAGDEIGAVPGIATGSRRNGVDSAHFHEPTQGVKPPQRGERLGDRVGCKQAGTLDLPAETTQRLFVEDRNEASRQRLVNHEPNRVRANVDDRDAGAALARPLHLSVPL